jgi:coenzyme F420-reducing hydrogenase gamma subunit
MTEVKKPILATTSLAGCFGCHMSFLDIDERILELVKLVEFNKSPIDDIKEFTKECDIGLVEGGCCNTENVRVLREFRQHCKVLISVGQCAITGGLPAMRNGIPLKELFDEAYLHGPTVVNHPTTNQPKIQNMIPNDEEIPMILDRVYANHEIVKVDYFLPGCPPRADLLWDVLVAILNGKSLDHLSEVISYESFKYD